MKTSIKQKGPWSASQVESFLDSTRVPIRIAATGSSGHPVLASLWFVRIGDQFWCATQRTSSVATLLARDPRCGFEVSVEKPPYRGIRGRGLATLHNERGEEILREVIHRYLGTSSPKLAKKLLDRAENETAIAIDPQSLATWDYRERMGEVG